ncbi:MAG: serine hydrolase [Bacteroidetes bacterium]|nr:serine hydrolase [Bacteroidota bacterium]
MKHPYRAILLGFICTAFVLGVNRSGSGMDHKAGAYAAKIDSLVRAYHELGMFQGAVLVALDDDVIYRKAFGLANREWGIPNTPETVFTIASLGKAFTAALVLQLVEEGRVALDDPISKHLTSYRADIGERVTIHHLMSHTAGIPWGPDLWPNEKFTVPYSLDELVESANQEELAFEPGTDFRYCNSCYNLLGAMIEEVTGNTFEDELQRRILDPLDMTDTGLVEHNRILERRASGYNRLATGEWVRAPLQDQSYAKGAGGMYSTVDDLYKWDHALYDNDFLSLESQELMFTAYIRSSGYGWSVGAYARNGVDGLKKFASGFGGTRGYASLMARLMDDRAVVIALGNMRPIPQSRLGNNIWNTLLDFDESLPEPSGTESLYQTLLTDGVQAAVAKYRTMEVEETAPSAAAINSAAYYYLESNRAAESIEISKFNLALHPDYAGAYVRLGEAYRQRRNIDLAARQFEKALEIDPENTATTAALKRIREMHHP